MNPMLSDILNEPQALRKTLGLYRTSFPGPLARLRAQRPPAGFSPVVFTGMGSSYFACVAAVNYLSAAGLCASAIETGELLHYGLGTLGREGLVVLTSQSGESAEAIKLAEAVQGGEGPTLLAVTNAPESTLGRQAPLCLHLQTAPDHSVAVKTYVSSIMALTLIAGALADEEFESTASHLEKALECLADQLPEFERSGPAIAGFLEGAPYVEFIGRGASVASALGGALLLREATKVFAAAITGGQVRHGGVEVVGPGYVAVLFAPDGRSNAAQRQLAREIVGYGGRVVLLAPARQGWEGERSEAVLAVPVEAPDEFTASLVEILPVQLASCFLAMRRGLTPGQFVNTTPVIVTE